MRAGFARSGVEVPNLKRFRAEAIVHELLHMKVPNHGKLFKALLRTHLANAR